MDARPTNPNCAWARDAASAAADDELGVAEAEQLAEHIAGCAACAEFARRVAVITRTSRIRVAHTDPVFVARVMATAHPARLGRGGWMRPSVVWCGLLVAFHNFEPLVFGEVDGVQSHLARHAGASGAALALCLLFVAWRPHRAHGLLPFVSALVALTLFGTLLDSAAGVTHAWDEVAHLAEVTGLVLLWLMAGSPGLDRARETWSTRRFRDGLRSTR
jgi:predicted anti-sigma-YlaC factor YlaD